jgi:hypothetical protein
VNQGRVEDNRVKDNGERKDVYSRKSDSSYNTIYFLTQGPYLYPFEILDDFIPTRRPEGVRVVGNPLPFILI